MLLTLADPLSLTPETENQRKLRAMDLDHDGFLSKEELKADITKKAEAIRISMETLTLSERLPLCRGISPYAPDRPKQVTQVTAITLQDTLNEYKLLTQYSADAKEIFSKGTAGVTSEDVIPLVSARVDLKLKKFCKART